jgi:hypothetical protein
MVEVVVDPTNVLRPSDEIEVERPRLVSQDDDAYFGLISTSSCCPFEFLKELETETPFKAFDVWLVISPPSDGGELGADAGANARARFETSIPRRFVESSANAGPEENRTAAILNSTAILFIISPSIDSPPLPRRLLLNWGHLEKSVRVCG